MARARISWLGAARLALVLRLRRWLRRQARVDERGVALISVLVMLAIMATAAAEFAYSSEVDLASAANARDDLRAHFLSRSSVNLSQLLLRVQQKVIEPNRKYLGGMDLQLADYAPMLITAFNKREGAELLGSVLGVDTAAIKGLGVDVGSFDLEMESLDGRLNLNCGGGANTGSPTVTRFAASLAAMMLPARYNAIFEDQDQSGQYSDRLEVLRAIIDWADQDTVMYGSSAAEDYRYNAGKDPYEIKNQYFDTIEELRLVKGVDDQFMNAFGDAFTVYGGCKVNVNLAGAPLIAALIVQHAAAPHDPGLQWQNLALLTRYVTNIRDTLGGFRDLKGFAAAIEEPMTEATKAYAFDPTSTQQKPSLPPVTGVKMNDKALGEAVTVGGPRRVWRITGSAKVGRIQKKIVAIWDTSYISMQSSKHNLGPGGYLYWREE
jgi:hypothetical protein